MIVLPNLDFLCNQSQWQKTHPPTWLTCLHLHTQYQLCIWNDEREISYCHLVWVAVDWGDESRLFTENRWKQLQQTWPCNAFPAPKPQCRLRFGSSCICNQANVSIGKKHNCRAPARLKRNHRRISPPPCQIHLCVVLLVWSRGQKRFWACQKIRIQVDKNWETSNLCWIVLNWERMGFLNQVGDKLIQWCKCQQEAVLKATAVRSPLPVMSWILPCPPCLPQVMQTQIWGGGGFQAGGSRPGGGGEGRGSRLGGQGHFIHLAMYTAIPHGACPKGTSHNYGLEQSDWLDKAMKKPGFFSGSMKEFIPRKTRTAQYTWRTSLVSWNTDVDQLAFSEVCLTGQIFPHN